MPKNYAKIKQSHAKIMRKSSTNMQNKKYQRLGFRSSDEFLGRCHASLKALVSLSC